MIILTTSLITIFLAIIETSFLPHFNILGVLPFITLAFITCLAVRYRGLFHLFLAFFIALYFDYLSIGLSGLYLGVFVSTTLIGRVVFYRESGYDTIQSFVPLLVGASLLIYLLEGAILFGSNFSGWQLYIYKTIFGTLLTLTVGLVFYRFLNKYFDWMNKNHEERFR